ncbi:hypothetical protein N9739_05115 [Burkholderiaceae bacterium]|nr:hypothetical protein [Burkholderiaceae bacterium]
MELWAMVGKAALDSPDLPADFVRNHLISRPQARTLSSPFAPQG